MNEAHHGNSDAGPLLQFTKKTKNGSQARRLLAVAAIDDGAMRAEAAKIDGLTSRLSETGCCGSTEASDASNKLGSFCQKLALVRSALGLD